MHLIGRAFEMDEIAKWLGENRDLAHCHSVTVDPGDGKSESRFAKPPRCALEQFRSSGDSATEMRIGCGTERVLKSVLCSFRQHACRIQDRMLHVIEIVEQ